MSPTRNYVSPHPACRDGCFRDSEEILLEYRLDALSVPLDLIVHSELQTVKTNAKLRPLQQVGAQSSSGLPSSHATGRRPTVRTLVSSKNWLLPSSTRAIAMLGLPRGCESSSEDESQTGAGEAGQVAGPGRPQIQVLG